MKRISTSRVAASGDVYLHPAVLRPTLVWLARRGGILSTLSGREGDDRCTSSSCQNLLLAADVDGEGVLLGGGVVRQPDDAAAGQRLLLDGRASSADAGPPVPGTMSTSGYMSFMIRGPFHSFCHARAAPGLHRYWVAFSVTVSTGMVRVRRDQHDLFVGPGIGASLGFAGSGSVRSPPAPGCRCS